jgi:DNA-binding GntR family transcriptional regulator
MITLSVIAQRVVESIMAGQVRPGARLGEQELAGFFEVSRTVVREALMQLQARGFVEVRPRSGWFVVEPSFEDARQTYAARRVLEPGMLGDAGKPLQSVLRRLRAHVAQERRAIALADAATRSVMLNDFHVCLAECLGNRFLTSMMVDLSARTTLVSALYQTAGDAKASNDDHAAIVAALAAGDMAGAAELMREHIDTLAACLDERRAGRASGPNRLRALLAPGAGPAVRKRSQAAS